jgi:TM2 domain-containing membrane protein YozV
MDLSTARKERRNAAIDRRRAAFAAQHRAERNAQKWGLSRGSTHARSARGDSRSKSLVIAYALWFLCYALSAHRLYIGAYRSAVVQSGMFLTGIGMIVAAGNDTTSALCTAGYLAVGASGLWILADALLLPGLCRNDSGGFADRKIFA